MAGLQPTADIRSPHLITIFWFWRLLIGIKKQQIGVIQETCSYLAQITTAVMSFRLILINDLFWSYKTFHMTSPTV
ncbi:hypothetical protein GDO78_015189 [Eleutherodactylus coqui]|uniref:Uncharacterized protein n=1 Tax=Eleutherodactylus coqui TaxID=57060 RepID=A0A8J6JPE1_ELECQ|nr:hypothetical protein GDO78_015189 [Eleutherodactylus coqui]